jgi:hypothetical protein
MLTETQRDPAYLIIKEWIPGDFQAELFEHTKKLRAQETEQYTANRRDGKRSQFYFVRRRGKSRKRGASTSPGYQGEQKVSTGRRRSAPSDRVRRTSSKDIEGTHEGQHERGVDVQAHQDEGGARPEDSVPQHEGDNRTEADAAKARLPHFIIESARDERQGFGDKQLASSTAMVESHEDLDRLSHSSAKNRNLGPAHKQGGDLAGGGKLDSQGADDGTKMMDAIVTGDDLSASIPSGRSSEYWVSQLQCQLLI